VDFRNPRTSSKIIPMTATRDRLGVGAVENLREHCPWRGHALIFVRDDNSHLPARIRFGNFAVTTPSWETLALICV